MVPRTIPYCDSLPGRFAGCTPVWVHEITKNISGISLFPNPSISTINLAYDIVLPDKYEISIYDLFGKVIIKNIFLCQKGNNTVLFDISEYKPGMYLIGIQSGNGILFSKFIKQ